VKIQFARQRPDKYWYNTGKTQSENEVKFPHSIITKLTHSKNVVFYSITVGLISCKLLWLYHCQIFTFFLTDVSYHPKKPSKYFQIVRNIIKVWKLPQFPWSLSLFRAPIMAKRSLLKKWSPVISNCWLKFQNAV